jgi:predicted TIM-barrel fold metal-dependent hydrolase
VTKEPDQVRPQEAPLEPGLPIIDPHHHLWGVSRAVREGRTLADTDLTGFERQNLRVPRYLLEDYLADVRTGGHDVRASVFVQCHAMYRADAAPEFAPIGETEFVNGIAAMSASGWYGPTRVAAGIVGYADLALGSGVREVLQAQVAAGNGRFRGIRVMTAWDADASVVGRLGQVPEGVLGDPGFRAGFAELAPLGLSFDAWLIEPQLKDVADLAIAFPDTQIVLNHCGTPLGTGSYAGRREELFPRWASSMEEIGRLPNVALKIGGLGMECTGFGTESRPAGASSSELAKLWRPYVETAVDAFGAERCMFESNFPVDGGSCAYGTLWNAFKRVTAAASPDEKRELYGGTAARVYRLADTTGSDGSRP